MRKAIVAVVALLLIVVGTGIAYAGIPGPDGVIHGCHKNSDGSLRVIDHTASCPNGWTALDWNQTGPAGTDGVSGYERVSETFEFLGGVGVRSSHKADCPAGKAVVGGGYDAPATFGTEVRVVSSYPSAQSRWWVEFYPTAEHSVITVYAVCAAIGS